MHWARAPCYASFKCPLNRAYLNVRRWRVKDRFAEFCAELVKYEVSVVCDERLLDFIAKWPQVMEIVKAAVKLGRKKFPVRAIKLFTSTPEDNEEEVILNLAFVVPFDVDPEALAEKEDDFFDALWDQFKEPVPGEEWLSIACVPEGLD